MSKYQQES